MVLKEDFCLKYVFECNSLLLEIAVNLKIVKINFKKPKIFDFLWG